MGRLPFRRLALQKESARPFFTWYTDSKVIPEATSGSPSFQSPSRKQLPYLDSTSLASTIGLWREVDINEQRRPLKSPGIQKAKRRLTLGLPAWLWCKGFRGRGVARQGGLQWPQSVTSCRGTDSTDRLGLSH